MDWFRKQVVRSSPDKIKKKAREGISCPFCISFYFAGIITVYLILEANTCYYGEALWWPAIWGGSVIWNEVFVKLSK